MFDQTFVDAPARARTPWTVAASITGQAVFVAALLLIPLLHPELLTPRIETPVYLPLHVMRQPPRQAAAAVQQQRPATAPRIFVQPAVFHVPKQIPAVIDTTAEVPLLGNSGMAVASLSGATFSDGIVGAPGNIIVEKPKPPKALTPAPAHEMPKPVGPQRVGGDVQSAKLVFGPKPDYPSLAKASRTQGTVRLQAIVAADGSIRALQVISGHPLLVRAALDAVRRWRYNPTLLNHQPVEVVTEIEVNFTLGGS